MKTVMIMAGGTGGHVFPGIALAQALQQKGVHIVWLGTAGGMEQKWVKQAQLPLHSISIKGLRGNGLKGWLLAPIKVLTATWQAWKIMRATQPDLVLGMGGFVCGPGGLACKLLGKPLVLHEQNAIPGLTNKLLARLADTIFTGFKQDVLTGPKVHYLGNPVRAGLEEVATVCAQQPCHLLVLGGSRGALALNETLPQAVALMPLQERPRITHQTGEKTLKEAQLAYQQAGVEADIVTFIEDMPAAYAAANMVVSRAGALTVSELMAVARPAIMVPYPHAVDDHQTANAQALLALKGGESIAQQDLTPEHLATLLKKWCSNGEKRAQASAHIRANAPTQATQKISQHLISMLEKI